MLLTQHPHNLLFYYHEYCHYHEKKKKTLNIAGWKPFLFTNIGEVHRNRRLFGTNTSISSCLRVMWLFKQLSLLKHRWTMAAFDLAVLFVLAGWNRGSLGHRCSSETKGECTRRHQHATVKYIFPARHTHQKKVAHYSFFNFFLLPLSLTNRRKKIVLRSLISSSCFLARTSLISWLCC